MRSALPPIVANGRVLWAVLLRETRTRFGRSQLGYLWAVFEPLMHVGLFCAIFQVLGRTAPIEGNTALFIMTGVVPWLTFSNIASRTGRAVASNRALLTYPHVTTLDLMVARVLLEATTMLWVTILLLTTFVALEVEVQIDNLPHLLAAYATIVVFASGIGSIIAVVLAYSESFGMILVTSIRLLYFVSGIFFIADLIPAQARGWCLLNPMLHMIEWFRSAFFINFDSRSADRPFALSAAFLCLFLGLAAERAARARVR